MTIHPFRPRDVRPGQSAGIAPDDHESRFPYDFHEDFADFDDADDTMNRYGSIDRHYRYAHRTISAPLLSVLTGIQIPVCQEFHHALFGLLEDIGDFDGLVATPHLLIAGNEVRLPVAVDWLGHHASPDERTSISTTDPDETADTFDHHTIDQHSLELADAVGCNPSLTIGSLAALSERLITEILDVALSCDVHEIEQLTAAAVDLLGRMPDSLGLVGGAVIAPRSIDGDTANVGIMEV